MVLLLGVAAWTTSLSSPEAVVPPEPAPSERPAATNPTPTAPAEAKEPPIAPYRPPLRTDRVLVAGADEAVDAGSFTAAEIEKLEAIRRAPSPAAVAAGDAAKDARREESRARREARRRGEDPGPRAESTSPGGEVQQIQDALDEEPK